MKLQYHGMSLEGTPTELAAFVRQYEAKPAYSHPYNPNFPWWWNTTGTGNMTARSIDNTTVYTSQTT